MASNKPSTDSSLIIGDEKITIRNMQLKDVSECYDLGISLFAFSSSLSRTFDRFVVIESYSSESEFCFVATARDKIIGFVLGTQLAKQQIIGYIGWIAVRRDYQRKGIGSTLVSLLEARMRERGIAEFLVDTPVSNLAAIKFLVQLGFGAPVKQVYMSRNFRQTKKGIAPIHVGDPIQIESPSRDPNVNAHKKPGEVTIRRMGINDIWPVYQIGETVFTETAVNLYRFWDEAQVTDAYESDGELALVAEVDGKVAGFALGSTLERIETKYGYLIWLAVDPSAHGLGIGSLLYRGYEQIIKEEFDDIDTIIIDTQASNHGAIRFFSRIGFEITDTFIYICKKVNQQHKEATEAIQQVMELIENSVGIEGTK